MFTHLDEELKCKCRGSIIIIKIFSHNKAYKALRVIRILSIFIVGINF